MRAYFLIVSWVLLLIINSAAAEQSALDQFFEGVGDDKQSDAGVLDAAPGGDRLRNLFSNVDFSFPHDPAQLKIPANRLSNDRAIYGTDDRVDTYRVQNAEWLRLAAACCALIPSAQLSKQADGRWRIQTAEYRHGQTPICPEEPFSGQPIAANCSGALVAPDIIATAGHCFGKSEFNPQEYYYVFGFKMKGPTEAVTLLEQNQVYQGREFVGRKLEPSGQDYALVRLDRPVSLPGVRPLPVRRSGGPGDKKWIGVIGHPSGLPQKVAFGGDTQIIREQGDYYITNLDSYHGNSGSPVFNAETSAIEGLLIRGEDDYVLRGSCAVSARYNTSAVSANQLRGEGVIKSAAFAALIPEAAATETTGNPPPDANVISVTLNGPALYPVDRTETPAEQLTRGEKYLARTQAVIRGKAPLAIEVITLHVTDEQQRLLLGNSQFRVFPYEEGVYSYNIPLTPPEQTAVFYLQFTHLVINERFEIKRAVAVRRGFKFGDSGLGFEAKADDDAKSPMLQEQLERIGERFDLISKVRLDSEPASGAEGERSSGALDQLFEGAAPAGRREDAPAKDRPALDQLFNN